MNKTALITGASGGIGEELARVHARHGGNLVLVARNKSKLEELKRELEEKYPVSVYVIGMDLSVAGSAELVYNELKSQDIAIDYLINNAGFGGYGLFSDTDWKKEEQMINLNVTALTHFTKLFVRDMIKKGSGKIMNLASTAAFQPGPTMAVYFAGKAYVLSFSEAIAHELAEHGITVTALCPGATTSGFQEAAAMNESRLFKGKKLPDSREVAEYGYKAMLKGKTVAIHGTINRILANLVRFTPRKLILAMVRKMQEPV